MKSQTMIRVSGMILLAVAVSVVTIALIYILQNLHIPLSLTTVSWNG